MARHSETKGTGFEKSVTPLKEEIYDLSSIENLTLGMKFRALRQALGVPAMEIAQLTGWSPRGIWSFEQSRSNHPSHLRYLHKAVHALGYLSTNHLIQTPRQQVEDWVKIAQKMNDWDEYQRCQTTLESLQIIVDSREALKAPDNDFVDKPVNLKDPRVRRHLSFILHLANVGALVKPAWR